MSRSGLHVNLMRKAVACVCIVSSMPKQASPGKFMDQVCDEGQDQKNSVLQHLNKINSKTSWSINMKLVYRLGASRELNPSFASKGYPPRGLRRNPSASPFHAVPNCMQAVIGRVAVCAARVSAEYVSACAARTLSDVPQAAAQWCFITSIECISSLPQWFWPQLWTVLDARILSHMSLR